MWPKQQTPGSRKFTYLVLLNTCKHDARLHTKVVRCVCVTISVDVLLACGHAPPSKNSSLLYTGVRIESELTPVAAKECLLSLSFHFVDEQSIDCVGCKRGFPCPFGWRGDG